MSIARGVLNGMAIIVLMCVLAACSGGGPSTVSVPAGWQPPTALPSSAPLATDRLAFDSDRTGNFELFSMTTTGSAVRQLTTDPAFDSWSPRVAPDRRTILFTRTPAGVHDRDASQATLWAVSADGSDPVELRPRGLDDWGLYGHAEWAPGGRSLVMVGGSRTNAQVFVTDPLGQQPRAVTNRPGTNVDPSFTPDGTAVVFIGCPAAICTPRSYEVYRVPVSGGEPQRLTDDRLPDYDPVYSPDGRTLAWLTNLSGGVLGVWDVRLQTGSGPVRRLVGDGGITSRPQFAHDGEAIFVHRIPPGSKTFGVYRVDPDGSHLVDLTPDGPGNNEYPSP